jgi:microcystin degradation protein MlrC
MSINTQRHRVFVAGLFHETHSFLNGTTGANDFVTLRGDAFLATRGDASPLGGVLEYAERCGWQVLPGIWGMAVPGGVIEDSVWESYWQELQTQLRRLAPGGVDAIYLVLHGAMVTQSYGDAEGELLCRIRSIAALDHVPIYGVLDLHANVSQAMIDASDCLVAYRENPHSDARESAVRAAEMLRDRLSGRCPAPRQRLRQSRRQIRRSPASM